MPIKTFILFVILKSLVHATPLDPRFFANQEFQNRFPGAFALQAESQMFVAQSLSQTVAEANALIMAIRKTAGFAMNIKRFPQLAPQEKIQLMKEVFYLQTKISQFQPPQLTLDDQAPKAAFFNFDPSKLGPGQVILNPTALFKDPNPYAALLFLIHETRHSKQFQLAYRQTTYSPDPATRAYRSAFTAQKVIFDQQLSASYCDFLTLNNEYEAFLFGNYIMEVLTSGEVDTTDMGTWASQFVPGYGLKIHLPSLAVKVGAQNLLKAFNQLEMTQYKEVYGQSK